MTLAEDKLHGSGLYAQIATIQDTVKRFDETMLTAAAAAVPHGIDRLQSVLAQVPITILTARTPGGLPRRGRARTWTEPGCSTTGSPPPQLSLGMPRRACGWPASMR